VENSAAAERLPPSTTDAPGPAGWRLGALDWIALAALSGFQLLRLGGLGLAAWATRSSARANPSKRSKPLLFYYSQVGWDEVWQRPQEFALSLARSFDVVYFGPLQIHRRLGPGRRRPYLYRQRVAAGDAEVLAITPQTFPGTYKNRWIFRLNQLLLRWEAILACPEAPDLVVTNSPFPHWLRETLEPKRMVYDLIDDFVAFAWAPEWSRACQERVLADSDTLLAGTRYLARQHAQEGRSRDYVASGVDLERWAAADRRAREGAPPPPELAHLPRPILGYAGSISDRLDRDLILEIAQRFPEASVVFIGPIHGSFGGELTAPNLHFLGPRPSAELPDYVCRFDAALIPFKVNEATRSLNPVKALEYLAAGCPVVAVPLPDLIEEFGEIIRLADGANAFCEALKEALALRPEERDALAARGREAIAARGWARQGALYTRKMLEVLGIDPDAGAEPPPPGALPASGAPRAEWSPDDPPPSPAPAAS
jgi:UDP-galactopyranose mutase